MEVKQNTLVQSAADIETKAAAAEATPPPPVVPPVQDNTVIPTPPVENNAPVIVPDAAQAPVVTPPPAPAPIVDEVIAFDLPDREEPVIIPNADAIVPPVTSWKDAVKNVPEDELAEMLGDDDFLKGMRKHIKNGGAPIDYITAKGVNWEKISDADILKNNLRNEFPNATPTQIDRLFNKKYSQTEYAEDEDKEDGLLLMSADARKLRQQKVEEQQRFKIADAKPLLPPQIQQPIIDEQKQARLEKDSAYISNHDATKRLFESKRVAIEIAEGVTQNFGIANPAALMGIFFKAGELEKYTRTPQGEPDVQLLQEAAMFIANRAAFKKQIYNAGKEAGLQSLVNEGQNAGKQGTVLPLHPSDTSVGDAFNKGSIKVSTVGKLAQQ